MRPFELATSEINFLHPWIAIHCLRMVPRVSCLICMTNANATHPHSAEELGSKNRRWLSKSHYTMVLSKKGDRFPCRKPLTKGSLGFVLLLHDGLGWDRISIVYLLCFLWTDWLGGYTFGCIRKRFGWLVFVKMRFLIPIFTVSFRSTNASLLLWQNSLSLFIYHAVCQPWALTVGGRCFTILFKNSLVMFIQI